MDQREAVRVPVRIHARCRCDGVVIDGIVEDLSRSGMFFRAAERVGTGSPAEIDLEVPGEGPLRLEAEVVRVEQSGPRTGIAFRIVDRPASSRPLANFIMRQYQHQSSSR